MKYFGYILLGVLVYWIAEFLSINLGEAIGSGPGGIGIIGSGISLLCAIVVICTVIIVDTIKNNNHKK